jgi:branched-chain amino acid transport system ATP-binding protein
VTRRPLGTDSPAATTTLDDVGVREALLELSGVEAAYGLQVVIRDVSLSVPPSSIVALLGPNGAGKTTLLKVASGLVPPRAGTVLLGGHEVTAASPHTRATRGLCLIPEGRGIFRSLSVKENLRLLRPPWVADDHIEKVFDAFPILRSRLKQPAGNLSGGQQQMLALSRVFLSEPKVVLFDEISMGLSPIVVDEIFDTLKRLAADGVAMLLVEQYVSRALAMSDHVYLLNQGVITFSGQSTELSEAAVMRDYLGSNSQQ